ncbi:MAG: 6-phosphofructokinase [Ignavibacteriales bacterium]|nr:6-phosphofructokinase [Ignavibacteriales bacterium]
MDPFHVRQVNADEMVEEVDLSDELLERLKAEGIDALISVVGGRGLSILYKLHRKGLNAVCVPRSIENDIAATSVSFGFNSALSFTIEMLDRVRQAAQSARKIGVVEVLGEQAGWLALQAGIAVCADAVLIPEIPCDLQTVAARLKDKVTAQAALRAGGGGRRRDARRRAAKAETDKPIHAQGVAVAAGDGRCQRPRHPAIGSGRRDRRRASCSC